LAVVIFTVPYKGFWQTLITGGHKVEPLWIGSAILAYTITEGYTMLADTVKRKLYAAGEVAGKAEERRAIMQIINANPGKSAEEIRQLLEKERGENLTPDLPVSA
jgi:hypothetical protein